MQNSQLETPQKPEKELEDKVFVIASAAWQSLGFVILNLFQDLRFFFLSFLPKRTKKLRVGKSPEIISFVLSGESLPPPGFGKSPLQDLPLTTHSIIFNGLCF